MKKLKTSYLTGLEQLDKHLVNSPKPFDWLLFNEDGREVHVRLYIYALARLPKDEFKVFMETYCPGGFYEQITAHISDRKVTNNNFFAFTKELLERGVWQNEICEYIRTKPFSDQQNQELINYIKKNNLPYD